MKSQWELYKALELIPDSMIDPPTRCAGVWPAAPGWAAPCSDRMQSLVEAWLKNFSDDQYLAYLERCFALDVTLVTVKHAFSLKHQLWRLLNQPLPPWKSWMKKEPQVQRYADGAGETWWQIYDPKTGQTVYFTSEEEVLQWLENHLKH